MRRVQNFVRTTTEFGRLKRVVVGRANRDFLLPAEGVDPGFELVSGSSTAQNMRLMPVRGVHYDAKVLDKAAADLDSFSEAMTREGIQVQRVKQVDSRVLAEHRTADWSCPQSMGAYSARDLILSVGDKLIITPSCLRSRRLEIEEYYGEWLQEFDPKKVIDMRPLSPLRETDFADDKTPIFDAASVLKVKEGVLAYMVVDGFSNECGLRALRSALPNYEVIALRGFYNTLHVDTTISILDAKTILYNCNWITEAQVNDAFGAYGFSRYLPCPEVLDVPWTLNGISSKFIGLNLLSLDRDLVAVISEQKPLIAMLEDCGFRVIPVSMSMARDFGGGPHCVTLDIERDD